MLKIALIGNGTIATYVAEKLAASSDVKIVQVICQPGREEEAKQAIGQDVEVIHGAAELGQGLDLVVDCAGHEALKEHGAAILRRGFKFYTVSNGAMADPETALEMEQAAKEGKTSLRLLSGAVGAMDALSAAAAGGLDRVTYKGCKPSLGWKGTAAEEVLDLDTMREPSEHFRGTARDAALRYPKNANVAATIALAGVGMDKTEVVLIADPNATSNTHEIEAEGAFGRFTFRIDGKPLPTNPKSSALTAMNVVRVVLNEAASIIS
ncbi:aspartate dehydrogenase [Curvivirga sp.]|uniref:aspartate dehydrogenase n=1 Tax=Curvivirga sp. TaxID=2856848 RepID=UPI003B58E7E3